jgi:hypothetical protein
MRSERTGMLEKTGRWDEALALCQDILDRVAPAPITRLCPTTRAGTLMARRGEATAWEYLDQAMADADQTGEPQSIVPVRLARAEACWLEGRAADAVTEAERADEAADTDDAWTYGAVAAWLRRTGSSRRPRSRRSCSSRPRPSTTTSPPCSPSSARRTATPPPPRPPSSACSRSALRAARGVKSPQRSDWHSGRDYGSDQIRHVRSHTLPRYSGGGATTGTPGAAGHPADGHPGAAGHHIPAPGPYRRMCNTGK